MIAPSGKVQDEGHISFGADFVAERLKGVVMFEPPAGGSPKLDRALKACRWGDFKTAAYDLNRFAKETGADADASSKVLKWIDELGTKKLAEADAARDEGDLFTAREGYAALERQWAAGSDYVKTAHDKTAELTKDDDARKVFAQDKTYREATEAETSGDRTKAATLYRKLAEACPGGKFAEWCQGKAKGLDGK